MDRRKALDRWLASRRQPSVAVFDLGTQATRLLVGPRDAPAGEWAESLFFNASEMTRFGLHVRRSQGRIAADNEGLRQVIAFLAGFREVLERHGIGPADTAAVATAAFRWLTNQDEVRAWIRRQAGVDVTILAAPEEARFALEAVAATSGFRWRAGETSPPGPNDALVLLDQGGGSTEVAYRLPATGIERVHSFDELGAMTLGECLRAAGQAESPAAAQRLHALIAEAIGRWEGFPELAGRRLVAYGVGTAVTKCLASARNYAVHNQELTMARMRDLSAGSAAAEPWLDQEGLAARRAGLPVFVALLEKLNLDRLWICGYGLRYGVYAARLRD